MLKEIGAALQWYAMLGARFFWVFPLGTVSAITLTFLAQLALIASLLLPMKIVMIMSSGNIPNVFPPFINGLSENILISALAAVAIGAFLFNSVATKTIENLAEKGAVTIQQHTDKLALFENQDNLAKNAVLKFSSAIANLLFVIAGLGILAWLYWELAVVVVTYVTACVTIYSFMWSKATNRWATISSQLGKHLNTLANIGFLTSFLTIVIDYMVAAIPGFLAVLLSIILSRQIFSQVAAGINSIQFLNNHQPKINAIAFENHAFTHTHEGKQGSVWNYLTDENYKRELIEQVSDLCGAEPGEISLNWMDTELPNILHFVSAVRSTNQKYLVKIFDKNKTATARHEATLLLAPPENLPSPKLLRATTTSKLFHTHIFDISGCTSLQNSRKKSAPIEINQRLSQITLSSELIEQYQRSRLMIWDRIDQKLVNRIISTATNDDKWITEKATDLLPKWRESLKTLPLAIHNPVNNTNLLLIRSSDEVLSTNWGAWSIEPSTNTFNDETQNILIILSHLQMLEKAALKQKYSEALEILKTLCQKSK